MKKVKTILLRLLISALVYFLLFDHTQFKGRGEKIYSSVFPLMEQDTAWVESELRSMTLREKCAQLVMSYADSRDTSRESDDYRRLIHLVKELKVGGLIFFQGDIKKQVFLTNKMQTEADVPLLISSDFERGAGMRLTDAVEFPYQMAVAAARNTSLTFLMGKVIGIEARAIGVHQNYSPLVDINHEYLNPIINIRAFSDDSELVTLQSLALIRGMDAGLLISTAKHFPGHGGADLDSHQELPLINRTEEEFENSDLIPFKESIRAKVKSIMIGHLEAPAYEREKGLPATLSKSIVTDLLQKKFGFDGLIVTDAMNMHAVTNMFSDEEAAVKAIQAGNDLILYPPDDDVAVDALVAAVENNDLTEERIDYSVRKMLSAKVWCGLDKVSLIDTVKMESALSKKDHIRLSSQIANESITMLCNENNIIPIDPDEYYATALITLTDEQKKRENLSVFEELAQKNFNYIRTFELNLNSDKKGYSEAMKFAKQANLILLPIFLTVRSFYGIIQLDEKHAEFVNDLLKLNKPVVIMSMGNPYVISDFPDAGTYLTSYGEPKVSQTAMFDAVLGRIDIGGKLPISIANTGYKIGDGMTVKKERLYFPDTADSNYDFSEVNDLMSKAVHDSVFPGGVLLIGHHGKVIFDKAFGRFTYDKNSREMFPDAIFDLASVSKVIGTTSMAMMLYDKGKLDLDEKVAAYLPEFGNHGKENVTIRNLLVHNSGLKAWQPFFKDYSTAQEILDVIMNCELEYPTGTKFVYSDWGMITLQKVMERITGESLDEFLEKRLFKPLGMKRTMYNPPEKCWYDCVPTEVDNYWRMTTCKGKVHDEAAYMLGGVAGHAGLFAAASDIAKLLQVYLDKGKYKGKQIFKSSTIEEWTTKQSDLSTRGLGWDTRSEESSSSGHNFSFHSFGHTGFTGTSVWVDKDNDFFVVLLTNRVYPTRANREIIKFRPILHDAVFNAVMYKI